MSQSLSLPPFPHPHPQPPSHSVFNLTVICPAASHGNMVAYVLIFRPRGQAEGPGGGGGQEEEGAEEGGEGEEEAGGPGQEGAQEESRPQHRRGACGRCVDW